jgi:hypothetical protein
MRFGTRNFRNLNGVGSLSAAVRELERYKFDLMGMQKVRCDEGGTIRRGIIFFMQKETKIINFLYTTDWNCS